VFFGRLHSMQLERLEIHRLFGRFSHAIDFPTREDDAEAQPSVTIIHGPNGVGKTTSFHMLNGMMTLDFSRFREVPVQGARLAFTTGQQLSVRRDEDSAQPALVVTFEDLVARLTPTPGESGPADLKDLETLEAFRARFFEATRGISFDLIDTRRLGERAHDRESTDYEVLQRARGARRRRPVREPGWLADRVARFISDLHP
jgi:hypothetical protein